MLFIYSNFHQFKNHHTESQLSLGDFNEEFEKGINKIIGFCVLCLKINLQKLIYSIPVLMRICFLRSVDPPM